MAVEDSKPAAPVRPAEAARPKPASEVKADDKSDEDRGDGPREVYAPAAAGSDPDSLERTAKQLAGLPSDHSNDHAEELRKQAAKDREAAVERDSKPQQRSAARKSES